MKQLFTLRIYILTLVLIPLLTYSQKDYWQQKVDYKIEVSLNDTSHELDGFITITYQNNSPQTLDFIYFHLWPNAYRDQNTPMAQQLLENGKTAFWYSKPAQRGYIDSLNFKANAQVCKWQYSNSSGEICKIFLNQALKTGETVRISTPFHVKLPETFSRMGHIGQSYQITQWYPKPAVYDKTGWHAFPYLDQGEFYSEFGSFDVSITLPENYVVGATGDLQDSSEIRWMEEKAAAGKLTTNWKNGGNMSFPQSSSQLKTIHFKQTNIHDFGWFADKRYHVLKGEVELPESKKKVTTWALFTNNQAGYWSKAPEYLHDAIYYYSKWVGEYPYRQVTAVDGTISAGSGMEYPNITVIGEEHSGFSLDDVMTHEVGHNWFYGMLGSNERDHAWMDEGINSYYEFRYIHTKYPNEKMIDLHKPLAKFLDLYQYQYKYVLDLGYQIQARENEDQPIELTSSEFTDFNYDVIVYGKSVLILDYLEAYLGTETFDKVMKKYFATWQYKHPQPEDVRKAFETETGKDLNWFFDDLLNTTKKLDYKIDYVKHSGQSANTNSEIKKGKPGKTNVKDSTAYRIKLSNNGDIVSPVTVAIMKKDKILSSFWVDGFKGDTIIWNPKLIHGDRIQIDPLLVMPEINRKNNAWIVNKAAHKFQKLKFQWLAALENQNRRQVFFTPYLAFNNYDKVEVGLMLYNPFVPKRKFEYFLAPAIGTFSKQFIGFGRLNYNFFPAKSMQRVTFGFKGKRYSYLISPVDQTINKIEPYINIAIRKREARSPVSQSMNMRSAIVFEDWIDPTNEYDYDHNIKETQHYYVDEIQYNLQRNTTLHPLDFNVTLQQGDQFIALFGEAHFKLSYKQKNQGFFVRVFAGGFPMYAKSSSDISAPLPRIYLSNVTDNTYAYWLQKDYMFDENFIDRNGRSDYIGRQVAFTGGGFFSITDFGSTSKFLTSANFSSSIYRYVPFQPFASAALIVDDLNKVDVAAELGISLVVIRNCIEIHLPLITTNNINEDQQVNGISKWYQKITFTLKIPMIKPLDLLRQVAGI